MDTKWRQLQIDHNRRARERLAGGKASGGGAFRDWEATLMFYEIVIAVDGYAEIRGIPVPKSHKERRAIVKRHLPHLADQYDDLYGLSLEARYYNGYDMTETGWRKAALCHEILSRSIPVQ